MGRPTPKNEIKKELDDGLLEYQDGNNEDERNSEYRDKNEEDYKNYKKDRLKEEGIDRETIPDSLVNTVDAYEEFGDDFAENVYNNYNKAITRKDREALDQDSFENHFFHGGGGENYLFGDEKRGYLLGGYNEGIFIPSHFAPKSIRQGYSLMKKLGAGKMEAAVFVTEDIADMLKKMPEWQVTDIKMDAFFRGNPVEKTIAHNHIANFKERLDEYLEAESGWGNEEDEDYDNNEEASN